MKRIYLGGETFVKDTEIIGVFDIDSATVSKKTRDFLEEAEKQNNVIYSICPSSRIYEHNGTGKAGHIPHNPQSNPFQTL